MPRSKITSENHNTAKKASNTNGYLNPFNFRAEEMRRRPVFAYSAARKLKDARNRNQSEHVETSL